MGKLSPGRGQKRESKRVEYSHKAPEAKRRLPREARGAAQAAFDKF